MRSSLLVACLLVLTLVAMGCRSSHDADSDELASLQVVSGSFWGAEVADGDQGEASVGQLSGNYALLMALSEAQQQQESAPLGGSIWRIQSGEEAREFASWAESGRFLSQARESWPECLTQGDSGVSYQECEYGFGGDDGSVSFLLDGSYNWSEGAADADLNFDFSISSSDLSMDWLSHWGMDVKWTDTTLDGDFDLDYSYGVSLGGSPPLGGTTFGLSGTIDNLTADPSCGNGPVAGTLDWTSTRRNGLGSPVTSHVTVEWISCGEATVTM